ncbi:MAG: sugar-transfer associated ATP-grasp domain-containing protein [Bacteroidota bacterium]
MFKKNKQLQRVAMGINRRNVELIYPHNQRKHYHLADDKIVAKEVFEKNKIACAKTYAVIEKIGEIESGWAAVQPYEKIAIKPANGRGGGGIKILQKNKNGTGWVAGGQPISDHQVFKHFADIIMGVYSLGGQDRVLVEYCIEPHPFFHEIFPVGVPDFRVILLNDVPVLSMLRVPTNKSDGKANLHQGGLGIGINMQTGRLKKGYDGQQYHALHPDSKSPIENRIIPLWQETLELSIKTSKAFPLQYVGVDIVLDKMLGPLLMEINVRPGLGIQMVNQIGQQELMRNIPNFKNILS